jgi:hypothetical protein
MSGATAPPQPPRPVAAGGRVYVLHIWAAVPPRLRFKALVRPIESEQWLGFTSSAELVAYLERRDELKSKDEP